MRKLPIYPLSLIGDLADHNRSHGRKTVLAHGTFDIPHAGHIRHLREAAELGDCLYVTITCDAMVGKGSCRPVFSQDLRAEVLASLRFVCGVAICPGATALKSIYAIRPNILAKGPECRTSQSPGLTAEIEALRLTGGCIQYTSEVLSSSTELLNKVLRHYAA